MADTAHREVHFEIQVCSGGDWTVLDLSHDKEKSLKLCEHAWKSGHHKAVRVIRETFNPESNLFDSMEICYHGRKFSGGSGAQGTTMACRSLSELYSHEGRRTLRRLLNDTLSNWEITPTELLHSTVYYARLEAAGTTMQAAVQRAAISQTRGQDESVQQRMNAIYGLVGRALKRMRKVWDGGHIPSIGKKDLGSAISALAGHGESREFLLAAALTDDLLALEKFGAKLERLLQLAGPSHPDWAQQVIDTLLCEILSIREVVAGLLPVDAPLNVQISELAKMARGVSASGSGEPKTHAKLRAMLGAGKLPQTRNALLGVIRKVLAGSDRLNDELLDGQLRALAAIRSDLDGAEDELLEEGSIADAIEDRCGRLINGQFVDEYLGIVAPDEALEKLLALERNCSGRQNKRRLAEFMMPFLMSRDGEAYFTDGAGKPLDRMRFLTKFQRMIARTGLDDQDRTQISARLDYLCATTMDKINLLERIDRNSGGKLEATKRLLALIAGNCFTRGAARGAAIQKLEQYMKDPDFQMVVRSNPDDPTLEAAKALIENLASSANIELLSGD